MKSSPSYRSLVLSFLMKRAEQQAKKLDKLIKTAHETEDQKQATSLRSKILKIF